MIAISPYRSGDNRDRTDSLLLARQVLSQLSYIPKCKPPNAKCILALFVFKAPSRNRTHNPLFTRQALFLLSYGGILRYNFVDL